MSSGGSTSNNAPRYPTPIQRPTATTGNMQQHPPPPMHSSGPPGAPGGGLGARPRAPNPHPARTPGSGSAPGHPSQMKNNASNSYAMTTSQHDKTTSANSNATTPTSATNSGSTATSSSDDKPQRKGGNNGPDAPAKTASSDASNKDSSVKADGPVASVTK